MANASVYYTLGNVDGKHDGKRIKRTLGILPGVQSVSVNPESNYVAVDYDTTGILSDRIRKALEKEGFEVFDSQQENRTE